MMKAARSRTIRLVFLSIAAVAMLLLIVGLSRVELDPGVPFAQIWQFLVEQFRTERPLPPYGSGTPGGSVLLDIYRIIFFIALAALPFAVILVMIDPELRKRVLRSMLRILLIMALLMLVMRNQVEQEDVPFEPEGGQPAGEQGELEEFSPEDFSPERISPWIGRGLSLTLGLLAAAIVVIIIVRARRNRLESGSALEDIAFQARSALEDIEKGGDLRNIVLQCYAEMIRVVREQRGIRRDRTVTAREFTDYLITAKLPSGPVQALTGLFEKARYSSRTPTAEDEEEAVTSLRAIVRACEDLA